LGKAVELLGHGLRRLLEASNTTRPVTRHRRRVPMNPRAPRAPR
jgi:hypothetical protein